MKTEYDIQAEKFLSANGIKFSFVEHAGTCPPYCDGKCIHGSRHVVTLSKKRGSNGSAPVRMSFDFWNSHSDISATPIKRLRPYDVLACISSDVYCADDFEDWCGDLGYDSDSRKAEATWDRCHTFKLKLVRFFTEAELNQLSEIQ